MLRRLSRHTRLPLRVLLASLTALLITSTAPAADTNTVYLPLLAGGSGGGTLPPVSAELRWSDPNTWPSRRVPAAGEAVTIPAGTNVLLDVSPPALASLTIAGALVFDQQDLALTVGWIMLHDGTLAIGSEQQPFTRQARITLNAADPAEDVMGMGTRGLLLMGRSRLDLFGSPPAVAWTQLGDHAAAGSTSLTLKEPVPWRAGDQIVIAPTDFYHVGGTERLELSAVADTTLSLPGALQRARWGKLQYVTDSGMALAPPATPVTPLVLDERAEVGNLSRNIVIQGADDALWGEQGFGAQVMAMEGGIVRIDGVELRRMGQRAKQRRYPVHLHGLSYRVDGTILEDASSSFVRNSAIWNSQNRCLVVHGTNGVSIKNNICYDIVGHAMFLEDAVEQRNTFDHNLVLKVRNPAQGQELLKHEGGMVAGSSGYWLTHPNNVFQNNVAADTEGHGIWYAFPRQPIGVFKSAPIFAPVHSAFGSFDNNVAHSNRLDGLHLDNGPANDAGDLQGVAYRPTADGKDPGDTAFEASLPYTISRLTSYKNGGALWHREGGGTLDRAVLADNPGTAFRGSADCRIQNSASIGNSLNSATPIPADNPAVGLASYHSACDVRDHLFINLPFVAGKLSGALNTSDYYIRPVDKGLFRDQNLRFINAPFGYRMPPVTSENWTLAGALWDPYGYAGPAGNYWTFDDPFLTDGTTCQDVQPAGQTGKSCEGPYYGLYGFVLDKTNPPWGALMPIEVTRDNGATWAVGDGNTAPKLGNMRHAALVKGGSYTLRFPGSALARNLEFGVENMLGAEDWAVLGVQFDGGVVDPLVYATTWPNAQDVLGWDNIATSEYVRLMQPAASLDEVRASDGDTYYRDAANNMVYIKLRRDLSTVGSPKPGSNDDLYRPVKFVITARP